MTAQNNGEWQGDERRKPVGWHVGKEIPIGFISAIVLQTMGGIWWASAISTKLDAAIATILEFKAERYTQQDAKRDRDLLLATVEALRARDLEIERRMAVIERQNEALQAKLK
jgi:hypothetical protein